jgi:hypothetical protein
MSSREENAAEAAARVNRYPLILDLYGRAMAIVMMFLGLRQWAVILGITASAGGMFEAMSAPWQLATMHLAVVDLVAAVGLWMRVAWGNVIWIYAAISEIALHSVFNKVFKNDLLLVGFHLATILGFVTLIALSRRAEVG